MRRNREPGTRNPLSCPLSKQRIMVCWETLQILAASPVVKTVFMGSSTPSLALRQSHESGPPGFFPKEGGKPKSSLILPHPFRDFFPFPKTASTASDTEGNCAHWSAEYL